MRVSPRSVPLSRRSAYLISILLVLLSILLGTVDRASAASFKMRVIVSSGDMIGGKTLAGFISPPRLNDLGQVLFNGSYSVGSDFAAGIFTQSSLLVAEDDVIDGKTMYPGGAQLTLNNNGEVFFASSYSDAYQGGTWGLFTPDVALVVHGSVIDGKTIATTGSDILTSNDQGDVAFISTFTIGDQQMNAGLFSLLRGTLLAGGDSIDGRLLNGGFRWQCLNDSGNVVFWASYAGGSGIFTQTSAIATVGDVISGVTLTELGFPWINDNNEVVFYGKYSTGGGIFAPYGLIAGTGTTIGGITLAEARMPQINNNGDILFIGRSDSAKWGLFTPDQILIHPGDVIEGRILSLVDGYSLNNNGDFVFQAWFDDGSAALVLAERLESVPLDIIPKDETNTISLRNMKNVSVAILSSIDFYAPSEVAQASLTFGRTGEEQSFLSCTRKLKDINGDGIEDLVCQFSTKLAAFQCGDTLGILRGATAAGEAFEGQQPVLITPCK